MDKLAVMFEKNVAEIASLKASLLNLKAKNESLEKKLYSDIKDINEQVDGVFGYFDNRMDYMFLGKAKEIDEHFTSTFTRIDSQITTCVNHSMAEAKETLGKQINSCITEQLSEAEVVGKMLPVVRNEINRTLSESDLFDVSPADDKILPIVRNEINKILDEKEVTIDFNSVVTKSFNDKLHSLVTLPLAKLQDDHSHLKKDISNLKSSLKFVNDVETKVERSPPQYEGY